MGYQGLRYIKSVKVNQTPKRSLINHHVGEPMEYPKVQEGYEGKASAIFSTQVNKLLLDLTKEMVQLKK